MPPFSPHDDPSFVDCVLYPPTSDADLACYDRESLMRQRVSKWEESTNGSYFPMSYADAGPTSVCGGGIGIHDYSMDVHEQFPEQPFSDKIASCFTESSTLKPPPPATAGGVAMHARTGSSVSGGYTHSDAFASPWTAHLSTPGLGSPSSSSNLDHLGCYMSSPASAYPTDLFMQPEDQCMYPSPAGIADVASVSLPQVQGMPDQHPVEDIQIENQNLFPLLTDLDKFKTSSPTTTLDEDFPAVKQELARSPRRSSPISTTTSTTHRKSSTTDRVQKPRTTRSSAAVHHQQRQSQSSSHSHHNHQARKGSGSSSTSSPKNTTSSGRTRQFKCSFADYGCDSIFATKNEWKRHVSSQHLQLGFYRCDVDKCNINHQSPNQHNRPHHKKSRGSHHNHSHTLSDDAASPTANDFNRKDLFTSHLRRMHAPWAGKGRANDSRSPTSKERESFDRSLDSIRERCWHQQREPPLRSQCGICGHHFQGERSWDDRMEHVGRHYERDEARPEQEGEDAFLREWAIEQKIVVPVEGGRWLLTSLLE